MASGQWLYLYARSKEDIERRFPEFYLFDVPPKRFDAKREALRITQTSVFLILITYMACNDFVRVIVEVQVSVSVNEALI